jgi:hypothetical protein
MFQAALSLLTTCHTSTFTATPRYNPDVFRKTICVQTAYSVSRNDIYINWVLRISEGAIELSASSGYSCDVLVSYSGIDESSIIL